MQKESVKDLRKLMWFAIGFTAACAAGIYLSFGIWLLLAALFCLPCAIVLGCGGSKIRKQTAAAVWGCLACFVWLYAYDSVYLVPARAMDGQTTNLNIEITDYSYDLGYGTVTDGIIEQDGKEYRVCVYLDDDQALVPGNYLNGSFRLRYTAAGGQQEETYHQGKGIFLLAYSEGTVSKAAGEYGPLRYLGARLRHRITALMDQMFPPDVLGFARGLLLGDSSLLTYEEDTAFQTSGLRHVIAVSGLHVSILFSLVYLLAGKRRGLTALLGIPVLILFAAIAGFTPSITRACIMQSLMILAMLLNREYDPPTSLGFAALVMLMVNPQTITSVSFQLSAGCMVGIFLFSNKISNYLLSEKRLGPAKGKGIRARLTRWAVGSVSVTLSAMTVTTPLCAWYFGCVSLVGIISNLLALWVISFVFYGIMLSCLAGAIWLPLGRIIAWGIAWPIRYVLVIAKTLGSFPLAAVYICSPYIVAWLIFCYALLTGFLLCKNKHPVLFGCCIVAALVCSLGASWAEARSDDYRITALDVGQGQCIVLQNEEKCYLVDCGGDSPETAADMAAEYLLSMGITRLDGIIATHYDIDHAAGIPLLLTRIPADKLYLPNIPDTGSVRTTLTEQYAQLISWVEPDAVVSIPEGNMTVFAAEAGKTDNESSLCILFQPENCDILITGDRSTAAEQALLEQTELPKLEILVAGHHGAKTSTGYALLAETSPAVVLISVGENNTFGHPAQETLDRLTLFGCRVLRTDLEGTIIIRG